MSSITGISPITNPILSGLVSLNTDTISNGNVTISSNSIVGIDSITFTALTVTSSLSAPEITNLTAGNLTAHNLITNLTNANLNLNTKVDALQLNTQYLSANSRGSFFLGNLFTSANLGVSGNLHIGSLNVQPNKKGGNVLASCYTFGLETTSVGNVIPTGITFASNSQSGYTIASSSIGRYSYPAYYAFNNGTYAWWSSQNSYDSGGNPTGTCATLVYQGGTVAGEWVSITFPYYLVLNYVSFYNDDGFFAGATFRTCYIYGQYDNGMIVLLKTYTMAGVAPAQGTYSFPVSTTQPFNRFYFQITLVANPNGGECAVKNIVDTGTILNKTVTENVYIPQSLEVGRTANNNILNTNTSLVVNGNTSLLGDTTILNKLNVQGDVFLGGNIKFQDFSSWYTDYTMSTSLQQGYYVFAGGLCIQWAYFSAPSNASTTFTYPKAMTYYYAVSATKASANSTGYSLKISSFSGTAVVIDTAYGSTNKEACYIIVIGKV